MAAPWTATTIGLSKSTSAFISRAWGDSPGPGGFFRKSSISLPAQNESPAPCHSTTRVDASLAASLKISARPMYIPDVIAFLRDGRFNSTRRMPSERSVMISSTVYLVCRTLRGALLAIGNGGTGVQAVDFDGAETELLQDLVVVLADVRRPPGWRLGDAVHLDRTADGRGELAARPFEGHDDLVRPELRIVDHLLRPAYGAECDVDAIERLMPVRHRLSGKDLVENGGELRHVRQQLRRIGEARILQEVGAADGPGQRHQLVGRDEKNEPGVVGGPIDVHGGICGALAIVQAVELRARKRRLDRHARRPDAFGEQRSRDIRALAGALPAIERGDDRGIEADRGG